MTGHRTGNPDSAGVWQLICTVGALFWAIVASIEIVAFWHASGTMMDGEYVPTSPARGLSFVMQFFVAACVYRIALAQGWPGGSYARARVIVIQIFLALAFVRRRWFVKSTIIDASTDQVWAVLRDFNGHDRWHPEVATSQIERNQTSDRIGCVRRFRLADGSELREQLLALSDLEQSFSYCLLDTPIPMFNYVAHVRLLPVTDGDRTFWHWESRFTTRPGEEKRLTDMVGEQIYQAGFDAIRKHLGASP